LDRRRFARRVVGYGASAKWETIDVKTVLRTLVEVVILGTLAVAVGFVANAQRGVGAIKPFKNYFDTSLPPDVAARLALKSTPTKELSGVEENGRDGAVGLTSVEEPREGHPVHPYQEISFKDVADAFSDPATADGVNLFVDARPEEAFDKGHIPGAIPCDPYRLESYIQTVLDRIDAAERVIVYCGGGDCPDSISLCRELLDFDVPYENVYLFAGGWKEWIANQMPVEVGN
jgi:rhodanese-related sulfurtransferase